MDDASLSPTPDASQPPEAELQRIVRQLAPLLGEPQGQPDDAGSQHHGNDTRFEAEERDGSRHADDG